MDFQRHETVGCLTALYAVGIHVAVMGSSRSTNLFFVILKHLSLGLCGSVSTPHLQTGWIAGVLTPQLQSTRLSWASP